jgi:hypothetical protein
MPTIRRKRHRSYRDYTAIRSGVGTHRPCADWHFGSALRGKAEAAAEATPPLMTDAVDCRPIMANHRRWYPHATESLFARFHEPFFNSIDPKRTSAA